MVSIVLPSLAQRSDFEWPRAVASPGRATAARPFGGASVHWTLTTTRPHAWPGTSDVGETVQSRMYLTYIRAVERAQRIWLRRGPQSGASATIPLRPWNASPTARTRRRS